MDTLYDVIHSQPVTNKLYEMNKLTEQIQRTKPMAIANTEDTEIGNNSKDEMSYAVKFTREAKQLPELQRRLKSSELGEKFRAPAPSESSSE
jgi:hypothetical protein